MESVSTFRPIVKKLPDVFRLIRYKASDSGYTPTKRKEYMNLWKKIKRLILKN